MTQTAMLNEILPAVRSLSRADKLRLIHELAGEMLREADALPFVAGASYPVWSPIDAFEAAAALQGMLDAEVKTP